jgi:hypothetical protein
VQTRTDVERSTVEATAVQLELVNWRKAEVEVEMGGEGGEKGMYAERVI